MKNLLVPTDFSENAACALDYAVDIANRFSAHITVLHAYHLVSSETVMVSVESIMKDDAEAEMAALTDKLRSRLNSGAGVEGKVVRGDAISAIARNAAALNADLIIMGTQGASGLKEIFSGSTANGVITHATVPVLAIPAGYEFKTIDNIIFAVDEGGLSMPEQIKALVQIAKGFNAKIRVFHKDTGESDKGIDPGIEALLGGVDHSLHYELNAEDIHKSLSEFAVDYQADLLCMIRRKRSFMESIFHQSATKREVFQIKIPMLVLHGEAG
jgi:nucleotide-binding universal stress UspA family protein